MPFYVKKLCTDFLPYLFDSTILTSDEAHILDTLLHQHLETRQGVHTESKTELEYKLLFRASEHGFSAKEYHKHCDEKSDTITILYNEYGYVFGGYFHHKWSVSDRYRFKNDRSARLFLLRSADKEIVLPKVYKPIEREIGTIRYYPDAGPVFGWGEEIHIVDACDKIKESYTRPGYCYNIPKTNEMCGGDEPLPGNGTHWKYLVKEYEIFQITKG